MNLSSKQPATLETGTILHKRYVIVKVLGRGDFGVVYLAHDRWAAKGAEQVAIKEMPMQMIVDCERQADLRAMLLHPAIPRICGYFVTEDHSYLVQELICGSDLEAILEAHEGFLPEKT